MTIVRAYSSPAAFKQALEQRLRAATGTGGEFTRKRQLLVFDRFLARIVAVLGDAVMLKGGLVLEHRLARARTTRDIDLRLLGSPEDILSRLQEAGRRDLSDFMSFETISDPRRHAATVSYEKSSLPSACLACSIVNPTTLPSLSSSRSTLSFNSSVRAGSLSLSSI